MERYLMWSGGKDSTASLILCHENGIHLDGIIFSEVMFDHSRNISAENPNFIKWVYETAIPKIEKMGYKVIVLRSKHDYVSLFNKYHTRSKINENGKTKWGFVLSGKCYLNGYCKTKPIKEFLKAHKDCEQIVGIAHDEPTRLENAIKRGQRSILAEMGIVENDTYEICKKYDLLNPTYQEKTRGGCWFCPNQNIKDLYLLRKQFPNLWQELVNLSETENLCNYGFKWGKTIKQIEAEIDQYEQNLSIEQNQMTIFE